MMPLHYVRRCQLWDHLIHRSEQLSGKPSAAGGNTTPARVCCQVVPCPNAFKVDMRATVESGGGVTTAGADPRANDDGARVSARRVRATFAKTEGRAKRAPTCAQTAVSRSLRHTPKFQKLAAP